MKIVHLIGYFQPEFGYKEYYIARNQAKAGHEVHVITSDRVFPFPNYQVLAVSAGLPKTRYRGVGVSTLDGFTIHRLPSILEIKDSILIRGVKELLIRIKPDIVHAYAPVQLVPLLAGKYKKELGYFLIFDEQQFESHHSFLGALRFNVIIKPLSGRAFAQTDALFCASQAAKDFVRRNYSVDEKKIKLIPLGVDSDFYHFDRSERKKTRSELGIKNHEILLISTARISKEKKFEMIINSMKSIANEKVKFLLVGDGDSEYLDFLKNLSIKNGLEKQVIFHQFVSEKTLYRFYSAADIGIWPKRPSICIVNAIGCELPVLIPNDPTMSHLVKTGNGLLFDPNDERDLSDKLGLMVHSMKNFGQMREKARQLVKNELSYKKLALKDIETYEAYKKIYN